MSNQGNYNEIDSLNIKIVASGITYVDIPFDTSWRILPYTVLTSIKKIPTEIAGSSICEFANGETRVFAPGTSIIIPRNVKHRFTNTVDPHTAVWIHWDVTIDLNLDIFNFCEIPPIGDLIIKRCLKQAFCLIYSGTMTLIGYNRKKSDFSMLFR